MGQIDHIGRTYRTAAFANSCHPAGSTDGHFRAEFLRQTQVFTFDVGCDDAQQNCARPPEL
jgi:hypothetical protein